MNLLESWRKWEPNLSPYIFDKDKELLKGTPQYSGNWRDVIRTKDFGAPSDKRLHLGLLPQPFMGNLRKASIYILLLNPGLGSSDYFAEDEVADFKPALLANLKQDFKGKKIPFIFLDPKFSWHGGYAWWHGKLSSVIQQLAVDRGYSFSKAREVLANKIACIEAFPYHSSEFKIGSFWKNLPSVTLVHNYVHDIVLPRVKQKKAIMVATRQVEYWGLPDIQGVINYKNGKERAASLHYEMSDGGKAILERMRIEATKII